MRDQADLLGVSDDHAVHERREHVDDRGRVPGRLDDHVVVVSEFLPGERLELLA